MKYDVKAFELLSNEEIADGIFDMRVKNEIDRYHIVIDIINHLDIGKTREGKKIIKLMEEKLKYHESYIREYGIDMEEVRLFKWE